MHRIYTYTVSTNISRGQWRDIQKTAYNRISINMKLTSTWTSLQIGRQNGMISYFQTAGNIRLRVLDFDQYKHVTMNRKSLNDGYHPSTPSTQFQVHWKHLIRLWDWPQPSDAICCWVVLNLAGLSKRQHKVPLLGGLAHWTSWCGNVLLRLLQLPDFFSKVRSARSQW